MKWVFVVVTVWDVMLRWAWGWLRSNANYKQKNVGMMSLLILYMSFRPSHISTANSPSFSVVHISHIKLMTTYNFSPTARHFQSFIFSSSWITHTVSLTVSRKSSQELLHHMKSGGFVGATYGNALGEKSQIPKKWRFFYETDHLYHDDSKWTDICLVVERNGSPDQ